MTHISFFAIVGLSGTPSDEALQRLSQQLDIKWTWLARKLIGEGADSKIKSIEAMYSELEERAYQMLLFWRQRDASAASYKVLVHALSSVKCAGLAETLVAYTNAS